MQRRVPHVVICLVVMAMAARSERLAGIHAYESQDYAEAVQQFKESAQSGDDYSQVVLGVFYDMGRGVPRSQTVAMGLYAGAVKQDNPAAEEIMGEKYRLGMGVPKDNALATQLIRLAAEQGDMLAELSMGAFYAGTDTIQAHLWSNLAAAQGNKTAESNRSYNERSLSPQQLAKAEELASKWTARQQGRPNTIQPIKLTPFEKIFLYKLEKEIYDWGTKNLLR